MLAGLSFLGVTPGPQTRPPQTPQAPPVFRGGTEIVALDVTVLNNNRLPVRGLTQADFTITEDGQPQRIVAFDAVDLPDRVDPPAKWMITVTPDVSTNSMNDSRLFVLVMDDAMMGGDPRAFQDAQKIAHRVVDELGPADLMAVVFPRDNRYTQDFTSDHTKLDASVSHFTMGFTGMGQSRSLPLPAGAPDMDHLFKRYSIDTVSAAAEFLGTVPDRRKILIYVSSGVPVPIPEVQQIGGDSSIGAATQRDDLQYRASEMVRLAREANVSVYTIDPCGLRVPYLGPQPGPPCQPGEEVSFLQDVAGATGGHATINTNDFDAGIKGIFRENASYYLVGYRSTSAKPASSTRRVDVKVNRPGVEIKYRRTYRPVPATDPVTRSRPAGPAKPGGPPEQSASAIANLSKALTGILPTPDMPLQVALAPFAIPGKKDMARVAIVLGLRQQIPETRLVEVGADDRSGQLRVIETIDLQTRAFTPEGKAMGSSRQIAKVTLKPSSTNEFRFEVLSQIDLKPGRYQLRLGAYRDTLRKSGSVYGDVVVPDFLSEKISLSGVVLTSSPALAAGGQEALKTLLPVVPTSERTFSPDAAVTVFCRAYQGKGKLAPVSLTIRIIDGTDRVLSNNALSLGLDKINASTRAGDIKFQLPVAQLPAGAYDLSIEASNGAASARRDVRFAIK